MFVRHGFLLAAVGVVMGSIAELGLTRLLRSLLFGVTTNDPWTYLLAVLSLMAAALLASYLPSLRAMAVDPIDALRAE